MASQGSDKKWNTLSEEARALLNASEAVAPLFRPSGDEDDAKMDVLLNRFLTRDWTEALGTRFARNLVTNVIARIVNSAQLTQVKDRVPTGLSLISVDSTYKVDGDTQHLQSYTLGWVHGVLIDAKMEVTKRVLFQQSIISEIMSRFGHHVGWSANVRLRFEAVISRIGSILSTGDAMVDGRRLSNVAALRSARLDLITVLARLLSGVPFDEVMNTSIVSAPSEWPSYLYAGGKLASTRLKVVSLYFDYFDPEASTRGGMVSVHVDINAIVIEDATLSYALGLPNASANPIDSERKWLQLQFPTGILGTLTYSIDPKTGEDKPGPVLGDVMQMFCESVFPISNHLGVLCVLVDNVQYSASVNNVVIPDVATAFTPTFSSSSLQSITICATVQRAGDEYNITMGPNILQVYNLDGRREVVMLTYDIPNRESVSFPLFINMSALSCLPPLQTILGKLPRGVKACNRVLRSKVTLSSTFGLQTCSNIKFLLLQSQAELALLRPVFEAFAVRRIASINGYTPDTDALEILSQTRAGLIELVRTQPGTIAPICASYAICVINSAIILCFYATCITMGYAPVPVNPTKLTGTSNGLLAMRYALDAVHSIWSLLPDYPAEATTPNAVPTNMYINYLISPDGPLLELLRLCVGRLSAEN